MKHGKAWSFFALLFVVGFISACGDGGGEQVEANIKLDQVSGQSVDNRLLELTGTVSGVEGQMAVALEGEPDVMTTVVGGEAFRLPIHLLSHGENHLVVAASQSGATVAQVVFDITYISNAGGFAQYQASGTEATRVVINEPGDPAYGAGIEIPPGSLGFDVDVSVESDAEHMPVLPLDVVAVGVPVTFQPIGQSFSSPITVYVPYTASLVPDGDTSRIRVFALSDEGWETIEPELVDENAVALKLDHLIYDPFVAVIMEEGIAGEVILDTEPPGATVYLDGAPQEGLTPLLLQGVLPGPHEVKLHIPGHNEAFIPFEVVDARVKIAPLLAPINEAKAPAIVIDPSIQDESTVSDNVFVVYGSVATQAGTPAQARTILSLNDEDSFVSLASNGGFQHTVSLQPGENTLTFRATDTAGYTGVSRTLIVTNTEGVDAAAFGSYVAKAAVTKAQNNSSITAVLTWNKDDTDVDLHMYDPEGNHAWYGDLGGIPGAELDIDDTDGFGPETFTYEQPIPGQYRARIHYYSDHGNGSTTASLSIRVGGRTIFSGSQMLSSSQPWDAHQFLISEFEIVSVEPADGIFTTASGENEIIVTLRIPEGMDPSAISFTVREVEEDFNVAVSGGPTGETKSALLTHKPLTSLISPAAHALVYEIKAMSGEQETEAFQVRQEVLSQIRQEYVDKRDFDSSFSVATPPRGDIINAGQYTPNTYFTFREFAEFSDYGPTYAIIDKSDDIAYTVREAWGLPLRVTSGWRNPRRNDSLDSSDINSLHQLGDAVDLNPNRSSTAWPAGVRTYDEAQAALTRLAREKLADDEYDILFHAEHLHIEYDPH